jgi:hypothetical protein
MITLESLCAAVLALLALIGFNIATGVAIELLPDGLVGPDARLPIEAGLVVAVVDFSADRRHAPPAAMLVFACRERLGDHHETPAPDEIRASAGARSALASLLHPWRRGCHAVAAAFHVGPRT